jgi:hypothetical protein
VLDRDSALERAHALEVAVGDRLRVVDEPVQAAQRHLAVHALEYRQEAGDRLVVGGVDPERPALLREQPHDRLELLHHALVELWPRLDEVLEVRRGPGEILAGAEHAQVVVAVAGPGQACPALIVGELLAGLLRKQVVAHAHRHLLRAGEALDHCVVVGIVLAATARVDRAGHAEAVQLAHEVPRGVGLILLRQHGRSAERSVQDRGARLRDEHPRRTTLRITQDRAAIEGRRLLVVAQHAQRGAVQERAIVQVQDEHGCFGRRRVDLVERGHAALCELEFAPAPDDAYPLRRRRVLRLDLQPLERFPERAHALPAQLEVVMQSAADHVQVRIVETRNRGAAAQLDHARRGPAVRHHGLR